MRLGRLLHPAGPPGILDMVDAQTPKPPVYHDGHRVEPHIHFGKGVSGHEVGGYSLDLPTLQAGDGFLRAAEPRSSPGLHFNEGHNVSPSCDDIHLAATESVVPGEDRPPSTT